MAALPPVDSLPRRMAAAIARAGFTAQAVFERLDTDRDGRLSTAELGALISSLQPDLPAAERRAVFGAFDLDKSGAVSADEFCTVLQAYAPPPQPESTAPGGEADAALRDVVARIAAAMARLGVSPKDVFEKADANGDARLSRAEFEHFVLQFQPRMPAAELRRVFAAFDVGGRGWVEQKEFAEAIGRACAAQPGQGSWGMACGGDRPPCRPVVAKSATEAYRPGGSPPPCQVEALIERLAGSMARMGVAPEELFKKLDGNGDDCLSAAELALLVAQFQPGLPAAEFRRLFQRFDADRSGGVDLREFCSLLRSAELSISLQRCRSVTSAPSRAPPHAAIQA